MTRVGKSPFYSSDDPSVETHSDNISARISKAFIRIKESDRFIKIREVEKKTGRKKSQIYADPTFPRPIKLSVRESAWLESEVMAWMEARVVATRGQE